MGFVANTFKSVGRVFKFAAPIAGAIWGGPMGATIGGAIGGAMGGGGIKGALIGGVSSGLGSHVGGALVGMGAKAVSSSVGNFVFGSAAKTIGSALASGAAQTIGHALGAAVGSMAANSFTSKMKKAQYNSPYSDLEENSFTPGALAKEIDNNPSIKSAVNESDKLLKEIDNEINNRTIWSGLSKSNPMFRNNSYFKVRRSPFVRAKTGLA